MGGKNTIGINNGRNALANKYFIKIGIADRIHLGVTLYVN